MGATFLMSYPGPRWQIRGGANFRSETKAATNPKAAMREWLALCDAITRAGGRILIMPPSGDLTGMMYTANSGHLFKNGDEWLWLVSKMAVAHRQAEREIIKSFWTEAKMPLREAQHVWEGQADIASLGPSRYVISWGVRSVRESVDEVRTLLPRGSKSFEVQLREPWFHGDTCMNPLINRAGDLHLLVFGGALVNRTVPDLRGFVSNSGEVVSIDEDDARAYACNALSVNGTVLIPTGVSPGLRGNLFKRGFIVEELDLPELFGKGGGGPRCLVNELRGFVLTDDAPSYVYLRDKLHTLAETYPETAS
jgi:N-dimethylarginine dimethylaminohydrolase